MDEKQFISVLVNPIEGFLVPTAVLQKMMSSIQDNLKREGRRLRFKFSIPKQKVIVGYKSLELDEDELVGFLSDGDIRRIMEPITVKMRCKPISGTIYFVTDKGDLCKYFEKDGNLSLYNEYYLDMSREAIFALRNSLIAMKHS